MSGKYSVNYWKGGKKNISQQIFDKKKINYLKKKKEQHAKKKLHKKVYFRINKNLSTGRVFN